jgi:hypothetical protein
MNVGLLFFEDELLGRKPSPSDGRPAADAPALSLHQSTGVYQCDVFSHSQPAERPMSFPANSLLYSTTSSSVWPSIQSETLRPQDNFRSHRTVLGDGRRAQKQKGINTPHRQLTQPVPRIIMQGTNHDPNPQPHYGFNNQAESGPCSFDQTWLDSFLSPDYFNQNLSTGLIPEQGAYDDGSYDLKQSTSYDQEFPQTAGSTVEDNMGSHHRPRRKGQDPPVTSYINGLAHPEAIHPLSLNTWQSTSFPLTPPSSTPREGASPAGGATVDCFDLTKILPQAENGYLASPVPEPLVHGSTQPATHVPSGQLFDTTWPASEQDAFFDPDVFLRDFDPNVQGYAEQPDLTMDPQQHSSLAETMHQPSLQYEQPEEPSLMPTNSGFANPSAIFFVNPAEQVYAPLNSTMQTSNYKVNNFDQFSLPAPSSSYPPLLGDPSPRLARASPARSHGAKGVQRAHGKDRQLIEWKNQGLSYKEIKVRGGFEEAESTLRGRYRTLTKPKHLRVRKPEWSNRDVTKSFYTISTCTPANTIVG